MDAIFMNSKNSWKSVTHGQSFNLTDKLSLKRSDKYITLSNLSIYRTWTNIEKLYKRMNLKYLLQHGMKNLNY